MIIEGKAVFKYPQTGQEVTLKECTNPGNRGAPCPFYRHYGWRSIYPFVSCSHDEARQYERDVKGEENAPVVH